jgi:hypothetical protein
MAKVKVSKREAVAKVKATENTAPVTVAAAPTKNTVSAVAPVKAIAKNRALPEGVKLLQPPSGQVVTLGQTIQIGRKRYGGDYFGRLTDENYALACKFMAACMKAIKNAEGVVTPEKLSLNMPNAHGTAARVFAIENSGGLQFHCRYFTQAMFDRAHKAGVQVFGNREKGQVVNGQETKAPMKAHSNSIHLTADNMALAVELATLKAATL